MRWIAAMSLGVAAWLAVPEAQAANCSFSISTLDFGTVDVLAGQPKSGTATLSISCTNVVLGYVKICPHIGAGSGGSTGGVRHMRNPSNAPLNYTLSTDLGGATLWGAVNSLLLGAPPTIELTLPFLATSISTTRTVYGTVLGGQQSAEEGFYQSQMTSSDVQISYSELPLFNCLSLQSPVTAPFTVQAEVDPYCEVTASDLDFGGHGVLSSAIARTGQVSVRCTAGTAYSVALNNGQTGTGPTARRMVLGAAYVTYGLYRDPGHGQPWGTGGQVRTGTGSGGVQNFTVHGLVPAQATPAPGVYSDVVVATVTY